MALDNLKISRKLAVGLTGIALTAGGSLLAASMKLGGLGADPSLTTAQSAAVHGVSLMLTLGLVLTPLISLAVGWMLAASLGGPAANLGSALKRISQGDLTAAVPGLGRGDEYGAIAAAAESIRISMEERQRADGASEAERRAADGERARMEIERARAAHEQAEVVEGIAEGLEQLARGDLTFRISRPFPADYAKLKSDFNGAMTQLHEALSGVFGNVRGIRSGAGEIAQASDDLSRRTEQQAASLEETASALDQITATVRKTAGGAKQASEVVLGARGDAQKSGEVVSDAVAAMSEIEKSAKEISQIIGVIDEIAFQTNLLALNAGVEAARAGEAGRGFAVVASEVRALAQRSAQAAKEIKELIAASTAQVSTGVSLVGQTGEALQRIVDRVAEIDNLVSDIAASAQEQATGLSQVNTAINQMDQVTQQNAAMVEQSTAAGHALANEAESLAAAMGLFRIGDGGALRPVRHATAPNPARSPAPPARRPAAAAFAARHAAPQLKTTSRDGAALRSPAPQTSEDGWEEF